MTAVLLVHHRVADFDAWKAGYDRAGPIQREHGVRHHHVWRSREDPNMVVVVHTFDSVEAAEAFVSLPELAAAMEQGGVDGSTFRAEILDAAGGGAL